MLCATRNSVGECGLLQGTFKKVFRSPLRVALKVYLMELCPYDLLDKVFESAVS